MPKKLKSTDVLRELEAVSAPARAAGAARFFKSGPGEYGEGDLFLGVTVPASRQIARRYCDLTMQEVVRLLKHPAHEARLTALLILVDKAKHGDPRSQREVLDLYLAHTRYVNNWDLVDVSAREIVGPHLRRSPALLPKLARSKNLWERRIAIIATQHFIRHDDFADTLAIAEILLDDRHDLIHKAAGWMLREVGKRNQPALERFLRKHAKRMPRTMLRYAIERFSPELRAQYMAQ